MKIAIFFSGRVSCYDKFLKDLDNYIIRTGNTVDLFMSVNSTFNQKIVEDLKPKLYNFEPYVLPDGKLFIVKAPETNVFTTCSQYYNHYIAFKLIEKYQEETKISYDVVVRYRSEVISNNFFLEKIPQKVEPNTIYIPNIYHYDGINDQIAFGDFNSMKMYAYLYECMFKYTLLHGAVFNPENLLRFHLMYIKINVKLFPYYYELDPKRAS